MVLWSDLIGFPSIERISSCEFDFGIFEIGDSSEGKDGIMGIWILLPD